MNPVNFGQSGAAEQWGSSYGRVLTVAGTDQLTADFAANNIGGRIEGG
jgi:hypothetical protein